MDKLIDRLPPIFKEMLDIQAICELQEEEFKKLEAILKQINNNLDFNTCDVQTLVEYEELLNIIVDYNNSIENRRQAIIAAWNNFVPYTNQTLKMKLNSLLGEDGYKLIFGTLNVTVIVFQKDGINANTIKIIETLLVDMLPAHIGFLVSQGSEIETESNVYCGSVSTSASIYTVEF